MTLESKTIEIVKSTIPLIAATGPTLTAKFYEKLFSNHPELKNIFNMSNQRNGAQREALFGAVCAYASNLENLAPLLPAVEKIAQKHASFNVTADMYPIVGETLLKTIEEEYNPGKEVLDAWALAYQQLADIFIARESQIYKESQEADGGWTNLRQFEITEKTTQSETITSFLLKPVDGKKISSFKPGQYVAVYIEASQSKTDYREIRHYSLTVDGTDPSSYRIAVKKESGGIVSTYLHDVAKVGDVIQLAPPHGDFFLDVGQLDKETPLTLISGGVGQTPLLSMLHTLVARNHTGPIQWIHSSHSQGSHAFALEVNAIASKLSNFSQQIWLSDDTSPDKSACPYSNIIQKGRIDISTLGESIKLPNQHFYFCGPVSFMQNVAKQLIDNGVDKSKLHYECFGPHHVI